MLGRDALERRCDPLDERGRGDGSGQAVEPDQPAGELLPVGHRGRVQQRAVVAVLHRPVLADGALDQPGRVRLDEDGRLLVALAQLPLGAVAVGARVELRRHAEVALAAGREAHVAAHAVEAEGADVVAVWVAADDIPLAAHEVEAVGIDRTRGLLVGGDRPVAEDHGALLRDGRLELLQTNRDLRREATAQQAHRHFRGGVVGGVRAAEREVLEGEAQRLGVGELAVEQMHRGRERGELGIRQVEAGQEVVLLQERIQLLAGEVVALRLQWHAESEQLAAIGIEAARECLVRHFRVALDGLLDVASGGGAPLRHQVRHERELTYEFVGVGCHGSQESMRGPGAQRLPGRRKFGRYRSCDAATARGAPRGALYDAVMAFRRLRHARAAISLCIVTGLLPGAVAAGAATPALAPDPAWWAPNARLLVQGALPSRPVAARFGTGLTGWTLLGPGAVSVRAGGPGGHYAALRDNTTLETPPLTIARTQQVVLISARAPVGAPLVHVTALDAAGAAHPLGDLRPTASWDTFAFNSAGLGGQTVRLVLDPVMGRTDALDLARVGESEQVATGMTLVRGAARRAAGLPAGALLTAGAGPFELRTGLFRMASDAATASVWIRGIAGLRPTVTLAAGKRTLGTAIAGKAWRAVRVPVVALRGQRVALSVASGNAAGLQLAYVGTVQRAPALRVRRFLPAKPDAPAGAPIGVVVTGSRALAGGRVTLERS